ncbi:Formylglycine-generating sulfatase enzyme [Planctomycetes bacterium CA13]|uniref:Formylglycine-generating sulfatase enzyme n=1 Tax=Novipirellula herctigrandis TaxID=2527986 RepID=A0A5C5ZCE8_9BACT|nr:Formylglycine-generating sulfatase enzyme [Planctomycetes bacterium CA13]
MRQRNFPLRHYAILHLVAIMFVAVPSIGLSADKSDHHTECDKLRLAIQDLADTFAETYSDADSFLSRLAKIESELQIGAPNASNDLERLRSEALLANPLVTQLPGLIVVKRKPKNLNREVLTDRDQQIGFSAGSGREIAMPSNHECNASLERDGYDNEICVLSPLHPNGRLKALLRPDDGRYVGELDLHFDGDRFLFTQSTQENWKIFEMRVDGTGIRQVSTMPDDVDAMDACYLPDGRIIFGSTASYQSVPCWHGRQRVNNLYIMDRDGANVRQLCFDQDHNFHPVVLPSGQVMYHRWDYTGICHIFLRQLMTMNTDGTKQRAAYGSNSWYPNSLFFPRPIPGSDNRLLCILSGYHGVHRMGQLVIVDPSIGWEEDSGIVQRISGRNDPVEPKIRDALVNGDWPMFLHPFPLSEKYFLVSCWKEAKGSWGIYLADVFDNLVLVHETPGHALLEPTPLGARPVPPSIPDQIDLAKDDATVFIHDVYAGPGLTGVPRGTIKELRLVAYHFGYRGLAGSDKIGLGGPWEAMRILGTVPVEEDGSANFRVPANTPISIQTLDGEGKAVQLMRSWFTAMPGERVSCVGCHETPKEAVATGYARAAMRAPDNLNRWHGPARGFDFEREVQPVLDRYCVSCHHETNDGIADFRSEQDGGHAKPTPIGYAPRLHSDMLAATGGKLRYSPAYDTLIHYIRRVGVEDDVSLLTPGEYHADTSPLVQMLMKGHHGVSLDDEAWDRIVTWIDLNGPCHGTWGDVFPIPDHAHERRQELRGLYGGPRDDPEAIHPTSIEMPEPVTSNAPNKPTPVSLDNWPLTRADANRKQETLGPTRAVFDLGAGVTITFIRVPAGQFVVGDSDGETDEHPQQVATIDQPFWIGQCEVTNAQFRRFDASHDSRYYVKRRDRADGKGLSLNEETQPAVHVSWEQADAFCQWLEERTGTSISLPSEIQWEYACRAGTAESMHYGTVDDDFSKWANMADLRFSTGVMNSKGRMMPEGGVTQVTGGVPHLLLEGAKQADTRFDDRHRVTAEVGSFRPNVWGLHDMHGNASEWTRSRYKPYPYLDDGEHDNPNSSDALDRRVVRGGSFTDPPKRSRSSYRQGYHPWHRVFNVGFRVVCNDIRLDANGFDDVTVGRSSD